MKFILQIIVLCLAVPCRAQPTGHSKIYLQITDAGDTLHFENGFKKNDHEHKASLSYKHYELKDISQNPTGFHFYPRAEYVQKTMMTDDHHLQIVKNSTDTMSIEILHAFNVYFMRIPFQKGKFRLSVNDGNFHPWNHNTLPYKTVTSESTVYDLSPKDWSAFIVDNRKLEQDYFVSVQFDKQQLLAKPVHPEDDPNFRNPRRVQHLKREVADFNFDGQKDYREHKMTDSTQWNYFIYKNAETGYVLDTLLSSLDRCYFDFDKNIFVGSKTSRIDDLTTQMDNYEYIDGVATLVRVSVCVQAFRHSEKTDCFIRALENGKWVEKAPILGCE